MQLEYICDMELVYREELLYAGKFLLVRPYGSEEGTGYGEGDGSVTGPRLQGSLRWVNHPHRPEGRCRSTAGLHCVSEPLRSPPF